jgi:Putative addiction module component
MNQRVRMIVDEARKLSREERREMFDLLEAEFAGDQGDGTPEEIEAAWLEEIRKRIAASERGDATFVDAEDVIARARKLFR